MRQLKQESEMITLHPYAFWVLWCYPTLPGSPARFISHFTSVSWSSRAWKMHRRRVFNGFAFLPKRVCVCWGAFVHLLISLVPQSPAMAFIAHSNGFLGFKLNVIYKWIHLFLEDPRICWRTRGNKKCHETLCFLHFLNDLSLRVWFKNNTAVKHWQIYYS